MSQERATFELPRSELARRRALLDSIMVESGLDALIVQGANNRTGLGGHFMWVSGISAAGSYPQTLIVPREGDMTIVRHGAFGEVRPLDPASDDSCGIGRHLGTPTFPAVAYTLRYDAELVAEELARLGARKVGLIAPGTAYSGFMEVLIELLPLRPVDVTDAVDEAKALKSDVEIAMLDSAAALQDEVVRRIGAHIRPGMRDFEVMAEAQRLAELGGAEGGVFLGSSFAPGDGSVPVRHRSHQNRIIQENDVFFFLAENSGPGGQYVHLSRYFCLGQPPAELVDLFGLALESQRETVDALGAGGSAAEIFAMHNAHMRAKGFPEEKRLHAHGQGYDLVERPLIRNDEAMDVRAGMNIGVHPFFVSPRVFASVCDNFLLTNGGARRLHQCPQEIFAL